MLGEYSGFSLRPKCYWEDLCKAREHRHGTFLAVREVLFLAPACRLRGPGYVLPAHDAELLFGQGGMGLSRLPGPGEPHPARHHFQALDRDLADPPAGSVPDLREAIPDIRDMASRSLLPARRHDPDLVPQLDPLHPDDQHRNNAIGGPGVGGGEVGDVLLEAPGILADRDNPGPGLSRQGLDRRGPGLFDGRGHLTPLHGCMCRSGRCSGAPPPVRGRPRPRPGR